MIKNREQWAEIEPTALYRTELIFALREAQADLEALFRRIDELEADTLARHAQETP